MKNAVIYARYSSDKQTEMSIAAQVRACNEYAMSHGINVLKVYSDEAVSGKGSKTAMRKQYRSMLRAASGGRFDTILIHKYDRIARNLAEHVNLEIKLNENNVTLIAVSQDFGSSKEAKIMKSLMWSLSEYYIDNLAEEARKGLRETALKGLFTGGVAPFGYDIKDQKYVINKEEAVWVQKIFDSAVKLEGFTDILAEMKEAGVTGKRGKPLKYTQVYEILRNEKYTGIYLYSMEQEKDRGERRKKPNAIRIPGAIPKIIDKEVFDTVQKIMNARAQTGKKNQYLCSGRVYCSCGAKMHAAKSVNKGHSYTYYRCSERCGQPGIRMDVLEDAVYSWIGKVLSDETQAQLLYFINEAQKDDKLRTESFKKAQKNKIAEKQSQIDALLLNMSSGALPPSVLEDVGKKIEELKGEISLIQAEVAPKAYSFKQIYEFIDNIKNERDKQSQVKLLLDKIIIKNATEIQCYSTLSQLRDELGCGGSQHSLPTILFEYTYVIPSAERRWDR